MIEVEKIKAQLAVTTVAIDRLQELEGSVEEQRKAVRNELAALDALIAQSGPG